MSKSYSDSVTISSEASDTVRYSGLPFQERRKESSRTGARPNGNIPCIQEDYAGKILLRTDVLIKDDTSN